MLDPYKILKISRDAPIEVVRAAYKVLASKHHPDKNPGDSESTRMMQDINDAYAILSDPKQRELYDKKWGLNRGAVLQSMRGTVMIDIKFIADVASL